MEELGITGGRGADESDGTAATLEQMAGGFEATLLIVRRNGRARLAVRARSPAHEMRAALDQLLEPGRYSR